MADTDFKVVRDSNDEPLGIAPSGIASVTKDVGIPYVAIMSSSPLEVYYGEESVTTLFWAADSPMPIHPDMRLSTTTTCWTYGTRTVS